MAEENEFVIHFVKKCLETSENEQNVVLNESSEALGNHSEIVRILVLAMTTADDGVGGSNYVWQVVVRFSLFYKQTGAFRFAKSKAINSSFKDYFDRSICNFQRLAQQKTLQIRNSSKFKSSLQQYWQKYKSQIVGLCSFNNFLFNYWPALNIQKDSNLLCQTAKPNF